ncbi:MAG: RNA polymerase sigma factor [Clostridia bacterium]
MDLEKLLQKIRNGDRYALVEVYNQTKRTVFSIAKSILNSTQDAEDVMQETYIKVIEKIYTYRIGTSPQAWIYKIAHNLALDIYRKRKRLVAFDEKYITDTAEIKDNFEAQEILRVAKSCLSKEEYKVLYLHTIGDMQHSMIAKTIGKSYATTRWIYAKALKNVQNHLEKEDK